VTALTFLLRGSGALNTGAANRDLGRALQYKEHFATWVRVFAGWKVWGAVDNSRLVTAEVFFLCPDH